jgi:hypothetical protein
VRRIEAERQQAAHGIDHRRGDIGRALAQFHPRDVFRIGKLRRIGHVIADVVLRRAFHGHADGILAQPAQGEAGRGGQAEGIGAGDIGAGQDVDQLIGVERRRLLFDERRADRADRLGRSGIGQQAFGIRMADHPDRAIAVCICALPIRRSVRHLGHQARHGQGQRGRQHRGRAHPGPSARLADHPCHSFFHRAAKGARLHPYAPA